MYVCLCKGITESQVREHLRGKCRGCAEDLISCLGLDQDDCCGRCIRNLQSIVALAAEE